MKNKLRYGITAITVIAVLGLVWNFLSGNNPSTVNASKPPSNPNEHSIPTIKGSGIQNPMTAETIEAQRQEQIRLQKYNEDMKNTKPIPFNGDATIEKTPVKRTKPVYVLPTKADKVNAVAGKTNDFLPLSASKTIDLSKARPTNNNPTINANPLTSPFATQ